jgi:hypothetical protein
MDGLLEQLKMYVDGSQPLTWVIGWWIFIIVT